MNCLYIVFLFDQPPSVELLPILYSDMYGVSYVELLPIYSGDAT